MASIRDLLNGANTKSDNQSALAHLEFVWRKTVGETYGGYVGPLTIREKGQLKQFDKRVAVAALEKGFSTPVEVGARFTTHVILESVIRDWDSFLLTCHVEHGLTTSPDRPRIAFLLAHADVAINLGNL